MLNSLCISDMGREQVASMHFLTAHDSIETAMVQIDEYMRLSDSGTCFSVHDLNDLREEFKRIQIEGTVIDFEALFNFKTTLMVAAELMSFAKSDVMTDYPALYQIISQINIDRRLITELNRLVDDKGEMPDNASSDLAAIRRTIRQKQGSIDKRIRQIMNDAKSAGWTDAKAEVTIRDGRLVIPVKASDKRQLRGFIHDESATGQTVYIEPVEIFDTSSEIRELEYAERREMNRILSDFTKLVRAQLSSLRHAWLLLGKIDFIRAKVLLSNKIDAVVPIVEDCPMIDIKQARHPILELKLKSQGKEVVPLDLNLEDKNRILIISGPNAGGKSVCLKTVGLLQYMFQCGLPIPVKKNSRCGIFKSIFIDIGDEQSLENDLSTYSSHLLNMKTMLENADEHTFLLIDEFGTGTEPQLGGSLAEAIILKLNEKNTFGVVTTHYANLKLLADSHEGFVNGAMLFDTRFMQPLYLLMTGRPGSSFAFEMARKIGLPKDVLDQAATISGEAHLKFEHQLQQIEIEKKEIRKKEQELRMADKLLNEVVERYKAMSSELEQKKRQLLHDANAEARNIIDSANQKVEHTIKEIRETQADKETTRNLRKELNEVKQSFDKQVKELEEPEKKVEKTELFKVGDVVAIIDMEVVGELVAVCDTDVTVLFDNVRLRTTPDKIQKVKRSDLKKALKNRAQYFKDSVANDLAAKSSQFALTLDVRGQRAEEALESVAKYLDEAALLSVKEVSILHGKGNGILRRLIREYLSHQNTVASFADASIETGGTGITCVKLK